MKLIDCWASPSEVINASDAEYLALSYVWGVPDLCSLAEAPQVFLETVAVTTGPGKRYLWCDNYWVEQNNDAIKMKQVRNMGFIYEDVYATMVAAVADNERYGLCGISKARTVPRFVELPDGKRLMDLNSYLSSAEDGTWVETSWCLQEQLPSQRLLIFSKGEAHFECRQMRCRESMQEVILKDGEWANFIKGKLEQERHHPHPLLSKPVSPKTTISKELLARPIHLYWQCVAAYKERKLSNDTDALNAFSGILQRFENTHSSTGMVPVPCLVGLPLIVSHLSELIRKAKTLKYMQMRTSSRASAGEVMAMLSPSPSGDRSFRTRVGWVGKHLNIWTHPSAILRLLLT